MKETAGTDMDTKNTLFNRLRILRMILKTTGAGKILLTYFCFIFADALIIYIFDPAITSYGDALWYCYAVISTAGFGDVVVTTAVGKICSVILTAQSILVIAIVTGVIVNFYTHIIDEKKQDKTEGTGQNDQPLKS